MAQDVSVQSSTRNRLIKNFNSFSKLELPSKNSGDVQGVNQVTPKSISTGFCTGHLRETNGFHKP